MSKFKTSDRVRVIEARGVFELGATGTVLDDSSMPDVKLDEITKDMNGGNDFCISEDNLELIPEQMTEESCKEAARKTMYGLPKRMATDEDYDKLDELTAIFPEDDEERQKYAVGTFICEFFPHAIAELARFSYDMQQKHNPGAPMGWAKEKSVGDGNQIFRHQMDGEFREVAWRGLEQLERFLTKMEPFNDK